MQTNSMLELARETRKKIRGVFRERVDTIAGYDFVDEPNHQMFKLNFAAYNYSWVQFNYENDFLRDLCFFQ